MMPPGCPTPAGLLDIHGLEPPASGAIAARWQESGRSTRAVIGACYDGPFGIDLSRDGPHALVAGTTGAGKSELLQTMIASLAQGSAGLRRRPGRHREPQRPGDPAARQADDEFTDLKVLVRTDPASSERKIADAIVPYALQRAARDCRLAAPRCQGRV